MSGYEWGADRRKYRAVVLVTTGSLNPIHRGHISMLERAATALEGRKCAENTVMSVVGAFISPSHDLYLAGKFDGKRFGSGRTRDNDSDFFLPADLRLELCEASVQYHPLIEVGRWETSQPRFRDFPSVATDLSNALQEEFGQTDIALAEQSVGATLILPPLVVYVCGSDVFNRCRLHRGLGQGLGVCYVSRGEAENVRGAEDDVEELVFQVLDDDETATFSSTDIRREMVGGATEEQLAAAFENLVPLGAREKLIELAVNDAKTRKYKSASDSHGDSRWWDIPMF